MILSDKNFYSQYGEHILSVWLITDDAEYYQTPVSKGKWKIDEVIRYDICTVNRTYHYRYGGKIRIT